jgi:hypothetical protein
MKGEKISASGVSLSPWFYWGGGVGGLVTNKQTHIRDAWKKPTACTGDVGKTSTKQGGTLFLRDICRAAFWFITATARKGVWRLDGRMVWLNTVLWRRYVLLVMGWDSKVWRKKGGRRYIGITSLQTLLFM